MYRRNIGIAIATLPEQPASLAVWFIAKNIEGYSFHPSIGVVQKKMELNYQDIRRLAEILRPTEEDSDSEDDLPQTGLSALGNVIKDGLSTSALFVVNYIIHTY
jgi:hypothetical protein